MFYHDPRLAFTVRVDRPNPAFARMLQQAIGGVEGEMRVMNQYFFQGCNSRGPKKYRDMLMNTATEEIGHIEMLATAVAMNLEGAPTQVAEEAAANPVVAARLGGTQPRHILSSGMGAMPVDANGAPFTGAFVIGTGNLAADMFANVHAEASGRLLATRLYEATDDPGMKEMLSFLIARDNMHQQQWLAVIEELKPLPVPNDFPLDEENQEFSHTFFQQSKAEVPADARWTSGPTLDGLGEFKVWNAEPMGQEPELSPAPPESHAGPEATAGDGRPQQPGGGPTPQGGGEGLVDKVKDRLG